MYFSHLQALQIIYQRMDGMKFENKLVHLRQNRPGWVLIFMIMFVQAGAQGTGPHAYGVQAVETKEAYLAAVNADSNQAMIELHDLDPRIVYELGYASTKNFTGRPMYPKGTNRTFMRRPAAMALLQVQRELNTKGLGLKIWDAYRPYSVTCSFWELVHDDRYTADPHKGSGHNRGIAADLTIIDLSTGKELLMPTGWDAFSDSAHHDYMALSKEMLDNRELLKSTMEKYGFLLFQTEWWHYNWPQPEHYDVLDLDFKTLDKLTRKGRKP
jgi:D-alanyl-D-alanine dipeptidase